MNDLVDDHRMEAYLRSFHPVAPPPLPLRKGGRPLRFLALAVAAAVVLVFLPQLRRATTPVAEPAPITLASANALLASASSWKAVIDDAGFAFPTAPRRAEPQRKSAIEFLSQEDLSQ